MLRNTTEIVGLALAIVGLCSIIVGNQALPPPFIGLLMLGMVLIIASLGVLEVDEEAGRPATNDVLVAGFCLCAGVFALWRIGVDSDTGPERAFAEAHLWPLLFGSATILALTWKLWGKTLAIAGVAAVLLAVIQERGLGAPSAVPIDRVQDMATALGFVLADAGLGWLLEAMLTTILPFFLLGTVLTSQTMLGSPMVSKIARSSPADRWAWVFHDLARLLAPTIVIAALLMTGRPGIDLSMIVMAMLLPTGAYAAWFWMTLRAGQPTPDLSTGVWRDVSLIGVAVIMLLVALAGGLTPGGSAMLALGLTIILGAVVTDNRSVARTVLQSLALGGVGFARLLVAIATVGLILAILDRSGIAIDLAQTLAGAAGEARLPLLVFSACVSIGIGAAMPALAAYLIVAALVGPALKTVGLTQLTVHLYILFACLGGMTIKNGVISYRPWMIGVGLAAVGIGFAFASNPELLLLPEALASVGRPDQVVTPFVLAWAIIRTGGMLYLLAVATEGFLQGRFALAKTAFCIAAALAIVADHPMIYGLGMLGGALIIMSSRGLADRRSKQS